MSIAFVEMIGGASGNMLLGALLDAGVDRAALEDALRTLPLGTWSSELRRVVKCGVAATYYDFVIPGGEPVRTLAEVLDVLERSGLTETQRTRAAAIYGRLGEAEARAHGVAAGQIHFHEVGANDAILDVAGACIGLDLLGVERLYCSSFPVGRGTIAMHHGRYPNPPPATAELLRGAPMYDGGIDGEMVTTTGAAVLTTLVERPGERPPMRSELIGYGAGRADFAIPNVLRISIGAALSAGASLPHGVAGAVSGTIVDEVSMLEANIDDMSPQRFELAIERVLAAGAFDVWLAPVTMKKSRPAVLFGAVAPPAREGVVAAAMLAETTTLGVRVRHERRYTLPRDVASIDTPLGAVRVKTARIDGQARRTLEYDDLLRIARERNRPFDEIAAIIEEFLAHDRADAT